MFNKTRYKAWFFLKDNDLRKKKKFSPEKNNGLVEYKGSWYNPSLEHPSVRKGLKKYYFFHIGTKNQITLYKILDVDKDTDIKDLLYLQESMKQSFEAIGEHSISLNWIHVILAGISMLLGGWILGSYLPVGVMFNG